MKDHGDGSARLRGASTLTRVLYKILRPLAKILMTHGVSGQEAIEALKLAFVDSAQQDFKIRGKHMSAQRISVLTGFNHMEVKRLRSIGADDSSADEWSFSNRAAAVVTGWVNDAAYQSNGRHLDLPMDAPESQVSFTSLVKQYSRGMTPVAVLDELLRAGTVAKTLDGDIRLRTEVYCPHESDEKMLELMGEQLADLLTSYDHNLVHPLDKSILQQVIKYENVPVEVAEQFQRMGEEKIMATLLELNAWLSSNAGQLSGSGTGESEIEQSDGRTVILGTYFFDKTKGSEK